MELLLRARDPLSGGRSAPRGRLIGVACSLCAVVTLFAHGASPAKASTLAYVKGGAVWVSAPDGSDAPTRSAAV